MKLWEKNYSFNKKIENYTVGNDYIIDQKLVKYDCIASAAHAKMLCKINILTKDECNKVVKKLNEIIELDRKGLFKIKKEDEDCHTAIENYLIKKLGKTGKKIHTARSRNDQVLTSLRLYYKDEIKSVIQLIDDLIKTLNSLNDKFGQIEIPGYTHMKKAMPSTFDLWFDAFIESMHDNKKLISLYCNHIDKSPLGTGAGYGLPIQIDRKFSAELLGFKKIQNNPLYVQNSRGKFESLILHGLNDIMLDLNKMSSDILLFSMSEFGFIELPLELCTGSSIMPNKKNFDVLELIRANYHKNVGFEFEIKNIIGNLISGYNRDLQLTKEPTIKGLDITKDSLEVMNLVLKNIKINKQKCKKAMTEELYATKKVYNLINNGYNFRDAYKKISKEY